MTARRDSASASQSTGQDTATSHKAFNHAHDDDTDTDEWQEPKNAAKIRKF